MRRGREILFHLVYIGRKSRIVENRDTFSCPLLRNFPPVAVCPIPTPIFTNVLITAQPRQGSFKLTILPLAERNCSAIGMASCLPEFSCMVWICQHCGAPFVDSPYRVKSEESGVVFLDLIVCHGCYVQARELGLCTEEIDVRYRSPAVTTADQEKRPTLRR